MKLIPIDCFLNRVFPVSFYKDDMDNIVSNRIYKPRKDCNDFALFLPIDWEALNKKEDRNWRMQLQGWAMFHPIMNFFDEYHSQHLIVDYFFDIAFDWYKNYGNDANDIVTSRMPESYAWYDMSVGFRSLVIAFFKNRIDFNQIEISKDRLILLEQLIDKHIEHLSCEQVFSLNNHGMFQIQGLMALIQLKGIEKYTSQYKYALNKMEDLILSQYDSQGVHLEHSPHYHFYALITFEKVLMNDWYNDKQVIREIVEKARAVKKWIVDPLARPACVGDSILTLQKSVDFSDNQFSEILETKISNGVLSNFYQSGYQVYRSNWDIEAENSSYVFFMGMYHTKSHKHRDCLSFEWFDNGEKIICDSGKYGYISDKYRNYFLSSRAHNSVEIEGFDILRTKPYGSCLKKADEVNGIILMEGNLDFPAIKHKRVLKIKPNNWIIVEDELLFKRQRKSIQWFHPEKGYSIVNVVDNRLVLKKNDKYLIIRSCSNNDVLTQIHSGDEDNMQGFVSENDFQFQDSFAIGFSAVSKEKKMVTILATSETAEKDALSYIYGNESKMNQSPVPKTLLGKMTNINRIKNSRYDLREGKYTYQYLIDNIELIFYANFKKDSDKLTIMLPGAVNRSKTRFNFQRHSWSEDIEGSVISFLDPTVQPENEITIGWFQGSNENYAIPVLIDFIRLLLEVNNIKEENLTIFGSSAGGFTSLKVANYFLCSRFVVINPQTRIYNYSPKEYQKLVDWIFPSLSMEKAKEIHKERLEITLDINSRKKPIIYLQNTEDGHHVHHHCMPLLENISKKNINMVEGLHKKSRSKKMLQLVYYSDEKSGHSPIGKEDTIKILNNKY